MPSFFVIYLPLLVMLGLAVVIDWRQRRIPNWLNLLTFIMGMTLAFTGLIPISPLYSLLGMLFYAVGRSIYLAGPRRRLWRSTWQFRFRSLFGSPLQRRTATAARASAWNGRPTPARSGRPLKSRRHRPADGRLSRS